MSSTQQDTIIPPDDSISASAYVEPPPYQTVPASRSSPSDNSDASVLPDAERRQITIIFADLVGSTELAGSLDPEDLRTVLHSYQEACVRVIRRFEGHIAKYMGDGILVYFGYPVAHEDDARRAVQSGLGMLEAIQGINAKFEKRFQIQLKTRIGVHTGIVIAGDMGTTADYESMAIVGQAPNIAARLQSFAEPDSLVISGTTHRLVQGYFQCRSLGSPPLKGVSQPIEVFEVLSENTARSRLEAVGYRELTPLVGRQAELTRLTNCWDQTSQGAGQLVIVRGEAGIGKSRLVYALKNYVADQPNSWLTECRCASIHQNSVLFPVIELLEQVALRFETFDDDETRLSKLEGFLTQYNAPLPESVPLLASLLSIPIPQSYPPLNLAPLRQKQKTLDLLANLLLGRASRQPVLFVIDDLHWADPSTLELIDILSERSADLPLMMVFATRPGQEFQPQKRTPSVMIDLARFQSSESELMVERLTKGKPLPIALVKQIAKKTDGVPLFVEEVTKTLLESGHLVDRGERYELVEQTWKFEIPTTLHDSLTARLDRLSTVKLVIQLGAMLGREFRYELLATIAEMEPPLLQQELSKLVEADLLYQLTPYPNATFQFKHALIQDAAYESLLKARRLQYHAQIAQTLIAKFPQYVENSPELIAQHFTGAGLYEEAVPFWLNAGLRALQRSANLEAVAQLGKGLELVRALSHDTRHPVSNLLALELKMLTAYGPALLATRGFADPEAGSVFRRAHEISQMFGDTPQLFNVIWGQYTFYLVSGDLATAFSIGKQLLRLASQDGSDTLRLQAHVAMSASHFFAGNLEQSLSHAQSCFELYDVVTHGSLAYLYGQDSGAVCSHYLALNYLWQGELERGIEAMTVACDLAKASQFSSTIAQMKIGMAMVYIMLQDWKNALRWSEEALAYAIDQGFPLWIAYGMIHLGYCQVHTGQPEAGLQLLQNGLQMWRSTGAMLSVPYYLSYIADACLVTGDLDVGLRAVEEAEKLSEQSGENWSLAILLRLRGDLLLRKALVRQEEVEECYQRALSVAREQRAYLLELQAALSIAKLWTNNGRKCDGLALLTPIYSRFTAGFHTAPLVATRAMLADLSKGRDDHGPAEA